jgi:predicted RNA-binding protein YlxR (DUF448 family)
MKPRDSRQARRARIDPSCQRLCAATGELKPVAGMIRFVLGPDRLVVPDVKRRLPGRGIWITANRHTLEIALRRKSFERSFKRDLAVSEDIVELTDRLLQQAALDALAISRKAGQIAIGFAKSEAAVLRGRALALIHAAEAAPDGVRKLHAARNRYDGPAIAVIHEFTTAQLDLALGRLNVIHAAVLAGPESGAFLARALRLRGFRAAPEAALAGSGMMKQAIGRTGRGGMSVADTKAQMRELG